jgi:hypothetical protein
LLRGPHNASTSAFIHACSTCKPASTATASSPSRADSAILVSAIVAASNGGITGAPLVTAVFLW